MFSLARAAPRLLLCLALLAGAAAHAKLDDVERYLAAAARLYENLDYERALEQLERARRHSRGIEDDIAIALYEGIILADLGKREESQAAFRTALLLGPDAKLPVKVSPKVAQEFEVLRAEVKKELAPIIARRDAERRAREEEERRKAQSKVAEERRQSDARAADERRQSDARAAEERRKADAQAAEERRREQALARQRQADAAARPAEGTPTDRPDQRGAAVGALTAHPQRAPDALDLRAQPPPRRAPVLPWVLGVAAAGAGGAGGYFGLQARRGVENARAAEFMGPRSEHLAKARSDALLANGLFAAAGTAAVSAIVVGLLSGSPAQSPEAASR